MFVAGFLFLFIIITSFASVRLGIETFSDLDADAKLQEITNDPRKFKIGIVLALITHVSEISLAVLLFIAFAPLGIILGIVWTISRTGEGSIQIYDMKSYWGLLNVVRQYPGTIGAEKDASIDLGRSILKTKNSVFTFAQILFSIGTLAYSTLFVITGVVPQIIGWFGIVAGSLWGFANGIKLVRPNFRVLWNFGGLLVLIFEIVLGGWLVGLGLIS